MVILNLIMKGEREGIMEEEKKGELKSLYSELRGYLKETPLANSNIRYIYDKSVWTRYNKCVTEIEEISAKDYSRFFVEPEPGKSCIFVPTYRNALGGLISKIYGEYFATEPNPHDGVPNTVITQSQHQIQTVQMILDIQSKIDEKISKYPDGSDEKSFLQKLRSSLSSISNVSQLIKTIHGLAKDSGLDIGEAFKIFT